MGTATEKNSGEGMSSSTAEYQKMTISQDSARALTDAGYMPLPEYLRLCQENGWKASSILKESQDERR